MTPAQSSRELFGALAAQGLSQSGLYAGLYGEVAQLAASAADGPARVEPADPAGCEMIAGHAAVGSASQRSMERCGLRLAHTKAIWSTP